MYCICIIFPGRGRTRVKTTLMNLIRWSWWYINCTFQKFGLLIINTRISNYKPLFLLPLQCDLNMWPCRLLWFIWRILDVFAGRIKRIWHLHVILAVSFTLYDTWNESLYNVQDFAKQANLYCNVSIMQRKGIHSN